MTTHASTNVFVDRSASFLEAIYGNVLGQLRAEQLLDDLEEFLREHVNVTTLVDIGAGHAPVTLTLLHRHPHLRAHLVEPSAELLTQARANAARFGIADERVTYEQNDLDGYIAHGGTGGDLVLCHAVANWTVDPARFIADLTAHCATTTQFVSLLFGASTGKALRFASQGNMADMLTSVTAPGTPVGSLIETEQVRPLDPDTVLGWIVDAECTVTLRAAVRVFADYVPAAVLNDDTALMTLRKAEHAARRDERYWRLGQLVHVMYSRNG